MMLAAKSRKSDRMVSLLYWMIILWPVRRARKYGGDFSLALEMTANVYCRSNKQFANHIAYVIPSEG